MQSPKIEKKHSAIYINEIMQIGASPAALANKKNSYAIRTLIKIK
jgi:hypothetical protein